MNIIGGFDISPALCGTTIAGVPVRHLDELPHVMAHHPVSIGILTVPVDRAQEVANHIIANGIKTIWNFTPFRIMVPGGGSGARHLYLLQSSRHKPPNAQCLIFWFGTGENLSLHRAPDEPISMSDLHLLPDNLLINSGKSLFQPSWIEEMEICPVAIFRIIKVGKGIEESFAERYFRIDKVGLSYKGVSLQEGLPHLSYSFDGALVRSEELEQ